MFPVIYNYLAVDYLKQSPYISKTIHKASELRKIYNTIIKINKKSPLYKVNLSKENQSYAISIKDLSILLSDTASSLYSDKEESVFHKIKVESSDPSCAAADIITEDAELLPDPFTIKICQLADKQVNVSSPVPLHQAAPPPGDYAFTVSMEESVFKFQYKMKEDSTNEEVLTRLSNFINKSSLALESAIRYLDEDTIQMEITSKDAGTTGEPLFVLKDTHMPENAPGLVDYFALNHTVKSAQNAKISIDGEEKETLSNRILLNKSLQLDFFTLSENDVSIRYVPDSDKIFHAIKDFQTKYNRIVRIANTYHPNPGMAERLLNRLELAAQPYKNDLEAAGVTFQENGEMVLEEPLVAGAIDSKEINPLFSSKGYLGRIARQASSIMLNPMEFVNKTLITYPNISKPGTAHPYITSIYSGMFFNYYC